MLYPQNIKPDNSIAKFTGYAKKVAARTEYLIFGRELKKFQSSKKNTINYGMLWVLFTRSTDILQLVGNTNMKLNWTCDIHFFDMFGTFYFTPKYNIFYNPYKWCISVWARGDTTCSYKKVHVKMWRWISSHITWTGQFLKFYNNYF